MDEEEVIDVVGCDVGEPASPSTPEPNPSPEPEEKREFRCDLCNFIGKNEKGLGVHHRTKHPGNSAKNRREKRKKENDEEEGQQQQRLTTKQLLGGRKRPKTTVENVDESIMIPGTDREASRLHELGIIDEGTPLGEYVRRGINYQMMSQEMILDEEGAMEVGQEVVIATDEVNEAEQQHKDDMANHAPMFQEVSPVRGSRHSARRYPDKIPYRLEHGEPSGKYQCYLPDCDWRGGYRSLRMDHIKAMHPDWKMPPRFILERISKDGIYMDPDEFKPKYGCGVPGCKWRGNYRASRSAHMRKEHPNEHAEKKRNAPGYNSCGTYACHFPSCTWRGWSRSTRSAHIKKAHPDWRPEDNRIIMNLTCFYCKYPFHSYDSLCGHIETHGGLGLQVDEEFESKQHFSDWLQRVERQFSIHFERSDLNIETEEGEESAHYILHCNCFGQKGAELCNAARTHIYQKHGYLKRRAIQLVTRVKNDCSVHLQIREHSEFGPIHAKGYLEHSGHRFGTPLLRPSQTDRLLYNDVLMWKGDTDFQFMALNTVEKLNSYEGFGMESYSAEHHHELEDPRDPDPLMSLRRAVEEDQDGSFFGVDFSQMEIGQFSVGYQTPNMQRLYKRFAPKRTISIDSAIMEFDDCEFILYSVQVLDDQNIPKCVMIYVTNDNITGPGVIFQQMALLDPRGPREVLTDISEVWVDEAMKNFKTDPPQILISEWNLMDYWAAKVEEYVGNEYDVFSIVCAFRRFLRVEELHQMQAFVVEFFEALFECDYPELAELFDYMLTDVELLKRWSPMQRFGITCHACPTVGVSVRTLRESYLNNEGAGRIDQWFGLIGKRIQDFNDVRMTLTYTTGHVELNRKFYYNQVTTDEGMVEEEEAHDEREEHPEDYVQGSNRGYVYDDSMLTGEVVVDEEIIAEIQEGSELQEGEEVIYEEILEGADPEGIPKETKPQRINMLRETTKEVIRSTRKKQRFAQLRDCPPEVLEALAAHAITHDGRKKEQRPFVYLPGQAKMSRGEKPMYVETTQEMRKMRRWEEGVVQFQDQPDNSQEHVEEEEDPSNGPTDDVTSYVEPHHLYNPQIFAPASMEVHHHEEIHEEILEEEEEDQKPCTSASMYR